jgi:hypothetical protein
VLRHYVVCLEATQLEQVSCPFSQLHEQPSHEAGYVPHHLMCKALHPVSYATLLSINVTGHTVERVKLPARAPAEPASAVVSARCASTASSMVKAGRTAQDAVAHDGVHLTDADEIRGASSYNPLRRAQKIGGSSVALFGRTSFVPLTNAHQILGMRSSRG